jgi:hypothetical protein
MTRRIAATALWLVAGSAIPMRAQGLVFVPSFRMSAVYDDNLYHRPVGEGDMTVRFSPQLDAIYTTERLALSSRYALDADRFARHPELTTAHGRQEASLDARYGASRRLSIDAVAAFTETQTPADLNDVTALTPGRARARRVTLHPSATYHMGPRTDASAGYTVTSETLRGGVGLTTQSATSTLEHRVSVRDTVRFEYLDQHFLFAGVQADTSRALTAEWAREVSRGTNLTLRAGPRLTHGVLAPEIAASVGHRLREADITVGYLQTQTTLIGLAGTSATRGISATAGGELRPRVRLRAASGLLRTRQGDLSSLVYRVSASCAWTLARRFAVEAGYDSDFQRGNLYTAQATQRIQRNVASVKLIVAQTAGPGRDR